MNHSELDGQSFYQSEPLIARLRGIIRDYPEGIGILKELIQNADDAQATCVEITLDWRSHSIPNLPDPRMTQLLGPAMLVYNNQVFTDRDFESIRHLGQSEKAQDLQKTGRFGIGFNAIYHVTDFPSFISRHRLIFFDPHGAAIPGTSRQQPGREWHYGNAGWLENYPEFMQLYQVGGLTPGVADFQGTLFRLPLRTTEQAERSEIRKQPFTESNVRELLDELIHTAGELLLFLKSVCTIRVFEIPATGFGKRQEILSITTKNLSQVQNSRQRVLAVLPASPERLIQGCRENENTLVSISYRHEIETVTPEQTIQEVWRVTQLICIDAGTELESAILALYDSQEKVIPWAGAAARISAKSTLGELPPIRGKVYCFLPLPLESRLPVHLNGFFNLNSSRDNLSSDRGQTGKDKPRAQWNSLLVRHVLAPAYANLLADLVEDIGLYDPNVFYQLWPIDPVTVHPVLENLPQQVIPLLYNRRVLRSAVEHPATQGIQETISSTHWVTPAQIQVLSGGWWRQLVEPLKADGIDIPNPPLPDTIIAAFKKAGCSLPTFTPAQLRQHLQYNQYLNVELENAPKPSLRKIQWIIHLLSYCLSDNYRDLTGLPLALLTNHRLQVFGYTESSTIYFSHQQIREIFAAYPEWFIHPDLSHSVALQGCQGIAPMEVNQVIQKLAFILPATLSGEAWNPDGDKTPNTHWLAKVYRYLRELGHKHFPAAALQAIPLLPGIDGKLYAAKHEKAPLWVPAETSAELVAAVSYFGVNLVAAGEPLKSAIASFIQSHPNTVILSLSGVTLVDIIHARYQNTALPAYHAAHYPTLLAYIAEDIKSYPRNYDDNRRQKLRQLPIYRTNLDKLVALNQDNVYLPGEGYEPPAFAGELHLLDLGKKPQEWLPFYQALQVPMLHRARLIQKCLLVDYPTLSSPEQLEVLTWIRDNWEKALREVEKANENPQAFKEQLASAKLIRCLDGRLRAIRGIYSPESKIVRRLLGEGAAIPDMEFYATDYPLWMHFFTDLGMQVKPSPDDLLTCVENLIQQAFQSGVASVTDGVQSILNYLVEHWEDLKNATLSKNNQKLFEALRDRAWLTVEQDPEKLQRFPAAIQPQNRLYKAQEICFTTEAHLMASCKPILACDRDFIKSEIRLALGFEAVNLPQVLDYFSALITLWENNPSIPTEELKKYSHALQPLYNFLYKAYLDRPENTDRQRQQLKAQFENRPCLWDEATQQFWKPIHAFIDEVPCFGSYRTSIPFTHRLGEVYQLLGQRRSPELADYLNFLQELEQNNPETPLKSEDSQLVLQVFYALEYHSRLEDFSLSPDSLFLTAKGGLRAAREILINDAPWRKEHISENYLLYPQITPILAQKAGCLSLMKDTFEQPKAVKLTLNAQALADCRKWQLTLNSTEFLKGLKRLIYHESENEITDELDFLATARIQPAQLIQVDLNREDGTCLASDIPGSHFYNSQENSLQILWSENRTVTLYYLAECLNQNLGKNSLSNLLPLANILDIEAVRIPELLNRLKIRALSEPEENSKSDRTLIEHWTLQFYQHLGYTQIEPTEPGSGFDYCCSAETLPKLQVTTKVVNTQTPTIRLSWEEWQQMQAYPGEYQLLVLIEQGDRTHSIYQIPNIWQTLRETEAKIKTQSNATPPTLIEFEFNPQTQQNDLLLNWSLFSPYLRSVSDELKFLS
ncbi:hypothetical protein H6G20_15400 [Desertifilum sp. FACHB-1129]|uniref:Sacsin/Nov domain-containing protein n=1 Tax=Desertifilum tharense IPPAS B-1220 TaxID=1781255 RepID=A0A1E5QGN3_9CYAN|nr:MULTISPECIES: hypothetical protein [Desertifilum]MDA0209643.1 hypothetical protein [Cyanobacteria bacterium FC1]MBD2313053.1 hypothetical protein [Desertifilum sp. FACHB-1129]MBD2320901.1 hypothetical protein [Desertifilum sp. FACHB-866]MBD2331030.1 hypothetical protein [Desertifilum sp. FACHB-868]OEJ73845.1 hypothetical protein BH720_17220 [Desertifilum tharense IPPAS B-1220]